MKNKKRKKKLILILAAAVILSLVIVLGFKLKDRVIGTQQTVTQSNNDFYMKAVLVVGFKKEVSQAKAEEILNNLGLKFYRTKDVNMGMKFFYETGETFLVRVPDSQELNWLEKLNKIPEVKMTGRYIDPKKALID